MRLEAVSTEGSRAAIRDLGVDFLRECFECDFETGVLTWKKRPDEHFVTARSAHAWNRKLAGKVAGGLTDQGYRVMPVTKEGSSRYRVRASHVVWVLAGNLLPDDMQLDHVNRTPDDNRLCNLRLVTSAQNAWNRTYRSGKSGIVGVTWMPNAKTWRATIYADGKTITLGFFEFIQDAVNARREAELKYRGKYCVHADQTAKLDPTPFLTPAEEMWVNSIGNL